MTEFENIEAFHTARGGRFSPESDYGGFNWDDRAVDSWARPPHIPGGHRYMVVHAWATGDWYAARDGTDGPVILLGTLEKTGVPERDVHEFFRDPAGGDGPGRPLSWFQGRIAEFNEKHLGKGGNAGEKRGRESPVSPQSAHSDGDPRNRERAGAPGRDTRRMKTTDGGGAGPQPEPGRLARQFALGACGETPAPPVVEMVERISRAAGAGTTGLVQSVDEDGAFSFEAWLASGLFIMCEVDLCGEINAGLYHSPTGPRESFLPNVTEDELLSKLEGKR